MAFESNAVFPVSALQRSLREVKAAASDKVVYITENGSSAWVFCSEAALEREIERAVEEALYEEREASAFARGLESVRAGRCFNDVASARAAAEEMRGARGRA